MWRLVFVIWIVFEIETCLTVYGYVKPWTIVIQWLQNRNATYGDNMLGWGTPQLVWHVSQCLNIRRGQPRGNRTTKFNGNNVIKRLRWIFFLQKMLSLSISLSLSLSHINCTAVLTIAKNATFYMGHCT